jgi:hypothetical protein
MKKGFLATYKGKTPVWVGSEDLLREVYFWTGDYFKKVCKRARCAYRALAKRYGLTVVFAKKPGTDVWAGAVVGKRKPSSGEGRPHASP